ncbi:unnamed protein product [Paramecium primaurelia]|uniref:t-SNARE coiled-coil homology domain-containing protein n=1 Tax=Paramecium primaurelia TaxID=5886 RepID=A0A8S1MZM0_PARPR|nr:unnamed protein product [Paramecium primaurelia]CAD8085858.1 unnamed protein product [Paramecium primaurelia]
MEIASSQYRDITQKFLSKVHIKLVAIKREQPNQFLLTAKLAKEKVDTANERLQEFHTTSQSTGLFNDQDYKLNTLLSQVKDDISQIHIHLNQLKTQLNNDLHQSIFDFVQQKALKTSDQFKKLLQSHTQRIKQQEEKRNRLNGERDRVIKRVGFNQKYQKLNETEEETNHQTIQMFEQKQNEEKLVSMQKIESMLNDIAGVFQRVGTMVRLQETMIERIDKYTDEAQINVSKGRKELQESHKRISSNRGLILKVFLILFIFAFIYIVFVL